MAAIATEVLRALDHLHTDLKVAHCAVDAQHVVCNDAVPDKYSSHFKLIDLENARFEGAVTPPLN